MKHRINALAFFFVIVVSFNSAQAQLAAENASRTATDLLRNTEQNFDNLKKPAPKPVKNQITIPSVADKNLDRLHGVTVNSPLFKDELLKYWITSIDQPVSAEKLAAFKSFAWDLFQRNGYLTFITLKTQDTPEGTILTVDVVKPVIGKITVSLKDGETGHEYAEEVLRRFSKAYPSGAGVDVAGFESYINAASYDLPVDLNVSLRQAGNESMDVVIELAVISHESGKFINGIAQLNNYGLSQFSTYQALTSFKFEGLTPLSEAVVSTQASQGIFYGRLDYEAPIVGTGFHWRTYGSGVSSIANQTQGLSSEFGVGLVKLVNTNRYGRSLLSLDAGYRDTQSAVDGVQASDHVEHNTKIKLHSEYTKTWVENFHNDISFVSGNVWLNPTSESTDPYGISGIYHKIEFLGRISQSLGDKSDYMGSVRWHGQFTDKNLEGYDRIALGGITSLRGYSSIDGVGDQGVVFMFDFVKHITHKFYAGVLYDVGRVKDRHYNVDSSAINGNDPYTLQDAGFVFGGKIFNINFTGSIAKSFGTATPNGWLPNQTAIGNWRTYISATYAF